MTAADPAPTALVTGGRRGIGRAAALALAGRGFNVAVTSRPGTPQGDLDAAVAALVDAGGRGLAVAMDLSDRAGIDAALEQVDAAWGPLDVLVNNALCDQPGSQEPIATMDFDAFAAMVTGEVVHTAYLTRRVLDAAGGRRVTVINVGSAAAEHVPAQPVGQGGWAYSYAATKAALHRLAPFLQLEYGDRVRAFTVDPGFVRTEALLERMGDVPGSAPPSVPAEVIAWLAVDPAADAHLGGYLHAREVAARLGL